jgi:hypothetical protein
MSWNIEFLDARRRLLECRDFRAQRALGHELGDGMIDMPRGSDVPSRVAFRCRFCGSTLRFDNATLRSDEPADWRLSVTSSPSDESCRATRERRERLRAVRMA